MKSRLLLDIVVAQGAAILELLAGEDETLLVWWDALLVLNLGLDVVDRVRRLHLEGDGLTREGLDEAVFPISVACPSVYSFEFCSIARSRKCGGIACKCVAGALREKRRTFALLENLKLAWISIGKTFCGVTYWLRIFCGHLVGVEKSLTKLQDILEVVRRQCASPNRGWCCHVAQPSQH